MMSWQAHYKIAERLLVKADEPGCGEIAARLYLEKALVHATLAKVGHEEYAPPITFDHNTNQSEVAQLQDNQSESD